MNQFQRFYDNITDFIFVENELAEADVIFVPGNRYPDMAERAAQLYCQGYGKWILPSGKHSIVLDKFQGPCKKADIYNGDYQTEGEFLADVLMKNGVPKDAIIIEDEATFTYDNAIRSWRLLRDRGIEVKKAIICCNSVHARRCKMYYELAFPECEFLVAPVIATGVTKDNWYRSQEGIESVLAEMDRCGRQFRQIIEELQRY